MVTVFQSTRVLAAQLERKGPGRGGFRFVAETKVDLGEKQIGLRVFGIDRDGLEQCVARPFQTAQAHQRARQQSPQAAM